MLGGTLFYSSKQFLFSISHIFDNIKSVRRKVSQPVNPYIKGFYYTITKLLCSEVIKPRLLLVVKPIQQFLLDTFYSNLKVELYHSNKL